MFYFVEGTDLITIVMHINDLTIVGSCTTLIVQVKMKLHEVFKISDEGEIHWILGFVVMCNQSVCMLSLSQMAYIEVIL